MNVRQLILKKIAKKQSVRAAEIVKETGFSREYINRFFRALVSEGKLILVGKANQAQYVKPGRRARLVGATIITRRQLVNRNLREDEVLDEIEKSTNIFYSVPQNIRRIMRYGFTEMLNNAIEHSGSKGIFVAVHRKPEALQFEVIDKGVGIFNNIRQKRKLKNVLEAVQDLLKGKQTTAPRQHSGEGIFFTSRVADILTIQSSAKKLIFNNLVGDVFIRDVKLAKGTRVIFSISLKSRQSLHQVFSRYSGEAYGFSKTSVGVKLYELGSEYISRSQARRILSGLEKFRYIILDFRGVKAIGQGFADEVFRVWRNKHADIKIEPKNMNENVEFMIKRVRT